MLNYSILANNPLFKNIHIDTLKEILTHFNVNDYKKNSTIFFEGDYLDIIYIIIDGKVEISKYDVNGNKNIVTLLSDYDMFAESVALAQTNISPYTVSTLATTKALEIEVTEFLRLAHKYQQLLNNIIDILANKNTYLTFKIDCLSKRTIRERVFEVLRYYSVINNSSKVKLPFNRSQLAEFLCVNRSALTRELSSMEDDNIFEYKNGYYILNDKKILE